MSRGQADGLEQPKLNIYKKSPKESCYFIFGFMIN